MRFVMMVMIFFVGATVPTRLLAQVDGTNLSRVLLWNPNHVNRDGSRGVAVAYLSLCYERQWGWFGLEQDDRTAEVKNLIFQWARGQDGPQEISRSASEIVLGQNGVPQYRIDVNQRKLFFLPENTAGYELRDLMADEGVGETSDMIHPLNPATQRLFGRISIESRKVGVRDSDGLVAAMGTLGGWDEPAQDLFEFISNCDGSISFRSKDGKYLVRKALDPDAPGVNKRFIERVFVGDRIDENAKWNIASLYLDKEGNEVPDGQAVRSFALEAFVPFYEMIRQPRQRRYLVPDFESLRVGLSDPYLKEKLINTLLTLERPLIRSLIPAGIAVATKTKYRPLTGFGGYGDF